MLTLDLVNSLSRDPTNIGIPGSVYFSMRFLTISALYGYRVASITSGRLLLSSMISD